MALVQRSSIVFLAGLAIAAGTSIGAEMLVLRAGTLQSKKMDLQSDSQVMIAPKRDLTALDYEHLQTAWAYISRNTRAETGLVDSVAGFPSTTLWDQGSYIFAMIGAHRTKLISTMEFEDRTEALLKSLSRLPLFEGKLPNKAYDTRTLEMVNYQNEATDIGIGWSALDLCRTLMALKALERAAPSQSDQIRQLVRQWKLSDMASSGELWGAAIIDEKTEYLQEGRLGYEQYAARAAALWGLDVLQAASAQRSLHWVTVGDVEVAADLRDSETYDAISPIVSEPYLLQLFEYGWDEETKFLAHKVYSAQEQRYRDTGQLTAVSEDHIDQDPFFLYSSVYSDGETWAVMTEDGTQFPEFRTVSTKAAMGWDAVFANDYTLQLSELVQTTSHAEYGWAAGIYESDGRLNEVYSLNTNAVIIEAIHFKAFGPMWKY